MGDEFIKILVGLFAGVVTLATISVVISRKSQTPQVIQATASALSNVVAAAVNPVHTSATNSNLSVPSALGVVPGSSIK